jgi:hypothetical protein
MKRIEKIDLESLCNNIGDYETLRQERYNSFGIFIGTAAVSFLMLIIWLMCPFGNWSLILPGIPLLLLAVEIIYYHYFRAGEAPVRITYSSAPTELTIYNRESAAEVRMLVVDTRYQSLGRIDEGSRRLFCKDPNCETEFIAYSSSDGKDFCQFPEDEPFYIGRNKLFFLPLPKSFHVTTEINDIFNVKLRYEIDPSVLRSFFKPKISSGQEEQYKTVWQKIPETIENVLRQSFTNAIYKELELNKSEQHVADYFTGIITDLNSFSAHYNDLDPKKTERLFHETFDKAIKYWKILERIHTDIQSENWESGFLKTFHEQIVKYIVTNSSNRFIPKDSCPTIIEPNYVDFMPKFAGANKFNEKYGEVLEDIRTRIKDIKVDIIKETTKRDPIRAEEIVTNILAHGQQDASSKEEREKKSDLLLESLVTDKITPDDQNPS